MNLSEAIKQRHSVRSFTDEKIEGEVAQALVKAVEECNAESGLHIQLCLDEPEAFTGIMANYGSFVNCRNYFAVIGTDDEKMGYYGEKLVLLAQTLGLNTCWVGMSYDKSKVKCDIPKGEKLRNTIALGYGTTQGVPRKSRKTEAVCKVNGKAEDWFWQGIDAALLAPTALNQQKFLFTLNEDGTVSAKAFLGFYSKVDLGIAKYHFEIGAGKKNFEWAK